MNRNDASAADPFGQIVDEFVEAIRQGQRPSVEEFARRYPEHADEIRDVLPALMLMEEAKSVNDSPGQRGQAHAAAAGPPLQQLGDYQILREVGRGGMGVVYEAQQLSLGRHVAIKVLPTHALLDPRQLGRFQREARSAARLHHTNIVPVFGVGEQDGLHYYVMQFIKGLGLDVVLHELRRLRHPYGKPSLPLGEALARPTNVAQDFSAVHVARSLLSGVYRQPEPAGALTTGPDAGRDEGVGMRDEERKQNASGSSLISHPSSPSSSANIHLPGQSATSTLSESSRQYWQSVARVGMQVADALAHAASLGVLHRDIKPSNLLLDDTGNVWVTDFGLAKAETDGDNLTHTGDIIGTLRYMAPERFNGQGDLRSDVYSLGLTLYEMLALRPAFDENDRNKLVKQVMHDEPVRPRKLNPGVPRDLETVVLKAIARDPGHRYQTPMELAGDLKRFVEDRPVKARRVNELEKFWRWCRRNPLPASLLAGIVLMFLAGFVGVSWQWRVAETAREDEKNQRNRAEALKQGAELARDDAVAARDEARQTRNSAARQAAGLLLDRGIDDARGGEPARALHLFVHALRALLPDDPQAAPLERVIRANLSAWAETVPALEHIWPGGPPSTEIVFSPGGEWVVMATRKDEIQCFRTDTGRPVGPPIKIPNGVGQAMVFAPDGRSLWVASPTNLMGIEPGVLLRLDPASGRRIEPPIPTTGGFTITNVSSLAVSPDGRYLVGAVLGLHPEDRGPTMDAIESRKWRTASILVWETATGRVVRKVDVNAEHGYGFMGLSPDRKSVTAWMPRMSKTLEGMTFSIDGNEPPKSLGPHPLAPWTDSTLQFRNHMRTALVIKDGQVHRWSVTNPGALGPGVPAPFRQMRERPAPDGRSAISFRDGRFFDTGAWPPRPSGVRFAHPQWLDLDVYWAHEQYSSDGRLFATWTGASENDRRLWRLPRPHSRPPLPPSEQTRLKDRKDYYRTAQLDSRAGTAILGGLPRENEIPTVRIVDVAAGSVRTTSVRHSAPVNEVAFAPDGRYFATAGFDGTARVWETATGRPAGPPLPHTNWVATVAFSPDGNTLAAGDFGPNGFIKLWSWRTGKEVRPPLQHDDIVLKVFFSRDGRYLAAVKAHDWSKKPELLIWDVESAKAVVRVPHANRGIRRQELDAQLRPDSHAVAACDASGVLRLWEVPSGKLLGERQLDSGSLLKFSADGQVVAVAANLGVRLLDGDTLTPLPGGFFPHADPVEDLAFSPDGAFLLTGHANGSAQLWDVATRKPLGPPAVLLGPIRAVGFTPDGQTCACVAADGTARRWPVPAAFAEPDLVRLADRVALMTGQKMGDSHGLEYVPAAVWKDLRAKLVGDGSTALVAPQSDADRHDAVAADAEQDGDVFGAEWHLDRLAVLRPNDWIVPARRGRLLAAAGRRDEAAAAYATARRLAPSPQVLADWLRAAAASEELAGRIESALWNLDRAVESDPKDWVSYAARAALADQAGKVDRATADMDAAFRLGAEPFVIGQMAERSASRATQPAEWARVAALMKAVVKDMSRSIGECHRLAIACAKAGDRAGYRAACAAIAKQMPSPGMPVELGETYDAVLAFNDAPGAIDDWAIPLAWVDWVLARITEREAAQKRAANQLKHLFLQPKCGLLYRAGRHLQATEALREAMRLHALGGDFADWAYLALAEHTLGHADAAKQAALKARAMQSKAKRDTAWEGAEVELLAAELDAALPLPRK
jgi:serine/threonine protein kinase/WD40 repeat protein/Flp pilus assembly protein TadD